MAKEKEVDRSKLFDILEKKFKTQLTKSLPWEDTKRKAK